MSPQNAMTNKSLHFEFQMLCCWRSPNNEVVFYEANNFGEIKARLSLPKLDSFYLAPRGDINTPGRIACYLPGQKGGPGFAKIFAYPAFHPEKNVIATKSFMTADRMEAKWSYDGTYITICLVKFWMPLIW